MHAVSFAVPARNELIEDSPVTDECELHLEERRSLGPVEVTHYRDEKLCLVVGGYRSIGLMFLATNPQPPMRTPSRGGGSGTSRCDGLLTASTNNVELVNS